MNPIRSVLAGLACACALAAPAAAQDAEAEALSPPPLIAEPPHITEFRKVLEEAAGMDGVVGLAAAVIEGGEVVLTFTAGETAAGSGEPVTPETAFRAASLTKSFTGGLLAVLEAEGVLDLDAEVPPDVLRLKGARQPTLLEVVSQQTGLPPNAYDNIVEGGRLEAARIRERLAEVDLLCPPGECYTYQNVAFSAAEVMVERATGLSYEDAVRRWLFEPLGLATATLGADALQAHPSWARPHRGWRRTRDRPGAPDTEYDMLPSAAGVNLTLNDVAAWARAHVHPEEGLPASVRERLFTPYIDSRRETRRLGALRARVDETSYALGWRVYKWGDRTLVTHSGYLSGYGAQVVMEPATGFAFVALWNADSRVPWRLWPTLMDLRTGDGPANWLEQL